MNSREVGWLTTTRSYPPYKSYAETTATDPVKNDHSNVETLMAGEAPHAMETGGDNGTRIAKE